MSDRSNNPPAFPSTCFDREMFDELRPEHGTLPSRTMATYTTPGMSLRQYLAGQAMSNPAICTGTAHEYELRVWFGERTGIRKSEIVAMQALDYADSMLHAFRTFGDA